MLGCAVADELYARFPNLPEGKLTQLRAALVREESLAGVAKSVRLGERLRADSVKDSMLADSLEAVIGAIFLDGGYDAARRAVVKAFGSVLETLDPGKVEKDPKRASRSSCTRAARPCPNTASLGPTVRRTSAPSRSSASSKVFPPLEAERPASAPSRKRHAPCWIDWRNEAPGMSAVFCPPDKGGASVASGGFCFSKNKPPVRLRLTTPLSGGQK